MQRSIYLTVAGIVVGANVFASTGEFFDRAFNGSVSIGGLLSIATSFTAAFCLGRLLLVERQVGIKQR